MLGVGGEDKGDREEETEEAEGTRPADNQVDPSPSLSLAAYTFFQELSMMHLKSDGQLHWHDDVEDNSEGGGDADDAQNNEGEQVESKVLWKVLNKPW